MAALKDYQQFGQVFVVYQAKNITIDNIIGTDNPFEQQQEMELRPIHSIN